MKQFAVLAVVLLSVVTWGEAQMTSKEPVTFTPLSHASFIIRSASATIYVDPTGDAKAYASFKSPDIILITDIHGDHLVPELVDALKKENTKIIAPKAVVDKLGYGTVMTNGQTSTVGNVGLEAIPMYNTTADRLKYHEKGRGNGYVVTLEGKRIYISGDTEDIKEMRALKNIDYAFMCMNLPYTMTPEQAASAVLEFKPKVVFPYHYRGSDVNKFKELVAKDKSIEVKLLKWYEQ